MANKKKSGSNTSKAKADLTKASSYQTSGKKQSQKDGKKKGGLIAYLKGVRQEFKKVVWPTRDELVTDTLVVIGCVVFFSVAFWLIDTGFLAALKGILGITLS